MAYCHDTHGHCPSCVREGIPCCYCGAITQPKPHKVAQFNEDGDPIN
jgi:hypothetical protein